MKRSNLHGGYKTREVQVEGERYSYFSLLEFGREKIERLPFSLRVMLEAAIRNFDGFTVTEEHVNSLLDWESRARSRSEVSFLPARVLLQDFTGVPVLVDLAAMRDKMQELGHDPAKINPFSKCDLVIDHSVQVDYFARLDAIHLNEQLEFARNGERYRFLKWGQESLANFTVVPPATGIVHQVNLEFLSQPAVVDAQARLLYPDSCIGTDSHTPMVNGLGVLAWGVGGIEAEAVMLGQPMYLLLPDVLGFRLTGRLPEGATATDLVLRITELCRQLNVVGAFVEFFGEGVEALSVPDRATIGNMAPEQGSTVSFFPVDQVTLDYYLFTGRAKDRIGLAGNYLREQLLLREPGAPEPEYTRTVELDLSSIEPAVAGPKRPQDRIRLSDVPVRQRQMLTMPLPKGYGLREEELNKKQHVLWPDQTDEIGQASVVIAAVTSCTNTSNPVLMIAAGLLAKKAVERGLKVGRSVKTSFAPGSLAVAEYLRKADLMPYLEQLGFHIVGFGCTTCIGNSGPLPPEVADAVKRGNLAVASVLSGNRNFEGRIHPLTKLNYLASPPLVVAYAIAGTTAADFAAQPLGWDTAGQPVFLRDIWPSQAEIENVLERVVTPDIFVEKYARITEGSKTWQALKIESSRLYPWDPASTYIRKPPFFDEAAQDTLAEPLRVLAVFGDSITTDHISPAGAIAETSPAGTYLKSQGVSPADFNSYGSRRGNHEVMMRGTFANPRLKNLLLPGQEGNATIHLPSGREMTFFDAAREYQAAGQGLVILAGKEYGSGSSRDWAAKGPALLGVRVVIAESFERIHRSNLIGMGILPLEFAQGENVQTLQLTGRESYIIVTKELTSKGRVAVRACRDDGSETVFETLCRIDAAVELEYYKDGGILQTVIKKLCSG